MSVPETGSGHLDAEFAQRAELQRNRRRRPSKRGVRTGQVVSGHPVMFGDPQAAVELGYMPEGGGYPIGLVEFAGRVMGVTDYRRVVHLCSGSVRAPLTFDLRPETEARCLADVRHLPIRSSSVDWVMIDPPYSVEHAEDLWGLGAEYPTGTAIFREVERVLRPGGMAAYLHFLVPRLPAAMERIAVYGVTVGPGYRIRALTIARRRHDQPGLF